MVFAGSTAVDYYAHAGREALARVTVLLILTVVWSWREDKERREALGNAIALTEQMGVGLGRLEEDLTRSIDRSEGPDHG